MIKYALQVFLDMAVLVDVQGDMLNDIESQVMASLQLVLLKKLLPFLVRFLFSGVKMSSTILISNS